VIRRLLFCALPFVLLFAGAIWLIRAQPYDDADLRAFLAPPDGCPAPCFMGIRPGVTTVEAAITILEAHEWVREVFITQANRSQIFRVEWQWSSSASPVLEQERIPRSGGRLIADNGIVQYMELLTRIPTWEGMLILGKAQDYTTLLQLGGPNGGPRPPKPITSVYRDIITIAWTDCPYPRNFWNAPVELVIADPLIWQEKAIVRPFVPATMPITQYVRELARGNCPR